MNCRKFIICFWLLFVPFGLFAQRFSAELQLGIAGTQMSGDQLSGFNKAGLIAGGGVRLEFSEKNSIGFRMLYFQKGSQKRLKNDGTDTAYYLLRLQYLEMPINIRHSFNERFFAELGPTVGYLIKSTEEDINGELPYTRAFSRFDISLYGSAGYHINPRIDFIFGYWQSILPVREHLSGATFRLNKGQYSSAITFSLMLNLGSGRKRTTEH